MAQPPQQSDLSSLSLLAGELHLFNELRRCRQQQHVRLLEEYQHIAKIALAAESDLIFAVDRAQFADEQSDAGSAAVAGSASGWRDTARSSSSQSHADWLAWCRHQELHDELEQVFQRSAVAISRLRCLQSLCGLRSLGSPGGGETATPATPTSNDALNRLHRCQDSLLQGGTEDLLALSGELEVTSIFGLVLPLLLRWGHEARARVGVPGSQLPALARTGSHASWLLPVVLAATGTHPISGQVNYTEQRRALERTIAELTGRRDTLRQELQEARARRCSHEEKMQQVAKDGKSMRDDLEAQTRTISRMQEETVELRADLARFEEELPTLKKDTEDIRQQLERERTVVAGHRQDIHDSCQARKTLEEQLRCAVAMRPSKKDEPSDSQDSPRAPEQRSDDLQEQQQQQYREQSPHHRRQRSLANALRQELADAYEALASTPQEATEVDYTNLRHRCEEALAENSALLRSIASADKAAEARTLDDLRQTPSQASPHATHPGSPTALAHACGVAAEGHQRLDRIGHIARQKSEIAELREQLRREELHQGTWLHRPQGARSVSYGGSSRSTIGGIVHAAGNVTPSHAQLANGADVPGVARPLPVPQATGPLIASQPVGRAFPMGSSYSGSTRPLIRATSGGHVRRQANSLDDSRVMALAELTARRTALKR